MNSDHQTEFEKSQRDQPAESGVVREFLYFLRYNKKYWLIPILVSLLAMGVLILLGSTAAAPFIYTLF